MSDDNERMPRTAYELIEQLDQLVEIPRLPTTARAVQAHAENLYDFAFNAGMRALVDQLIDAMKAEIEEDEEKYDQLTNRPKVQDRPDTDGHEPVPTGLDVPVLFAPDGSVRSILSSVGVDKAGS